MTQQFAHVCGFGSLVAPVTPTPSLVCAQMKYQRKVFVTHFKFAFVAQNVPSPHQNESESCVGDSPSGPIGQILTDNDGWDTVQSLNCLTCSMHSARTPRMPDRVLTPDCALLYACPCDLGG